MTAKQSRRERKKANRARSFLRCEDCGARVVEGGDHDSAWSHNHTAWDRLAIVAWCPGCGHEYASNGEERPGRAL